MIGFGAGVGQMSAIFGLQTCCNELLSGQESELTWRNREAVVGQLRDLPASPRQGIRLLKVLGFMYNLRWRKCSINKTAHCRRRRAGGWHVFSLAVRGARP